MGYTHYWDHVEVNDQQWREFTDKVKSIYKLNRLTDPAIIQFEDDDSRPPVADQDLVRFNGIDDDGHETFLIDKSGASRAFCKTAQKPYDAFVVAVLHAAADIITGFTWSSDGDHQDHAMGKKLWKLS